ncbi:uncharacterized protein LOC124458023 [Xenia sp. Carnegie-2017]|uniref:uncharacterized protein LOC124458023 n=1 Tax=Xenia sp. Carnegie-2017 TaxID=2897299 RepID=UPI001F039850|nr:uncharacterized protein LOC124458023 [Xenia sp. Carnegie-2017]
MADEIANLSDEEVIVEEYNTKKKKAVRKWTTNETNTLIDLFEERPCLWDIFQKDYHCRDVKELAYEEMKNILGISVKDIKARLVSLRAQLGREIAKTNKTKSGQSSSQNYSSSWAYWDRLQFLRPVMNAGKSKDNLSKHSSSNISPRLDSVDDEMDTGLDSESVSSKSSRGSYKTPTRIRAEAEEKKRDLITTCIDVLKEPMPASNSVNQCPFSMYVAEKLSKFPPRTRIVAEKRITDIIFELEINEMNSSTSHPTLFYSNHTNANQNIGQQFTEERPYEMQLNPQVTTETEIRIPFLRNAVQY